MGMGGEAAVLVLGGFIESLVSSESFVWLLLAFFCIRNNPYGFYFHVAFQSCCFLAVKSATCLNI